MCVYVHVCVDLCENCPAGVVPCMSCRLGMALVICIHTYSSEVEIYFQFLKLEQNIVVCVCVYVCVLVSICVI